MTRKSITGILSFGALVPFIVQLGIAASGCSSADDNTSDGEDGGGNTGGSATGGSPVTGGSTTGGSATGGAATGGSATGGSSSGGECMAIAPPVGCSGIRSNMACPTEGQECTGLPCGVSDVGRRACNCTGGIWACEGCMFPTDYVACPIMEPPAMPLAECSADIVEGGACNASKGDRCMQATDVCICWPDDEGAIIWNCDRPPTHWAM